MEDAMKLMEEMNRFEAEIATDMPEGEAPQAHRPIIGVNTFQTVQKRLDDERRPGGFASPLIAPPPRPMMPMPVLMPPPPPGSTPNMFTPTGPPDRSFAFPGIPPPPPPPPFLIPHQVRGMRPMPPVRLPPPPPPIQPQRQRPGPVVLCGAPTKYKPPNKKSKVDDELLNEFFNEIKKEEEKMGTQPGGGGEKSAAKLMAEKVKANTVVSIQPVVGESSKDDVTQPTGTTKGKKEKKIKKTVRSAGGQTWEDNSLMDWEDDDFRIFCGDLGNDVTDEILIRAFNKYPSFLKAKVVRDKRTNKTKGFGFVSFKDPQDFIKAMKEMNGRYVGSRPIKLRKSSWRQRSSDVVKKKEKEKAVLINLLTGR